MNRRPSPEDEAAAWLIRRDRGLSATEQDEFLQWLATDARHGAAFAREQSTWRELDALAQWRPENSRDPNPDLLAAPHRPRFRRHWQAAAVLAAAALVLIMAYSARRFPIDTLPGTPPLASGYERRLLDDGSIAELNRGAALAVAYSAAERRVRLLRGEALFTVATDPRRPFVVGAGDVETRAVGTAFHVRLAAGAVEVLVTEGTVQVQNRGLNSPSDPAVIPVAAGERVVVPLIVPKQAPLQSAPVSAEEIARVLAWQPKLLEFVSAPLAQVVAEFNRHNSVRLVLMSPDLASVPVAASFRSDNVEGFVRLLEVTAGLRAEREGDEIRLRSRARP